MTSASGSEAIKRIGVLGYGFIGASVCNWINQQDELELAFVYNRNSVRLQQLPEINRLENLEDFQQYRADIIIEAAHPSITQQYGQLFLAEADYIPLSVTALADQTLFEELSRVAKTHQKHLLIPHGALVGLDSLLEWKDHWEHVRVTFIKHPNNIDFLESGVDPGSINTATELYNGSARGIASLYPRNVNTMVSCGLATVGLDAMQAVLIADPAQTRAVAEVEAIGVDGSRLSTRREQPATGVSGTEMIASCIRSLVQATATYEPVDFL
jgi:aspartate dehydrogenase